jgi:hypothetical protein
VDFEEIERELLSVIDQLDSWLSADEIAELASLARAGEPGVALENLCTELFEVDALLPLPLWDRLRRLSEAMGIDPKYTLRLKP